MKFKYKQIESYETTEKIININIWNLFGAFLVCQALLVLCFILFYIILGIIAFVMWG
jgi:hypothetical protein